MHVTNYTEARSNLKQIMDMAFSTEEPVLIISKKKQVVVISKTQYDLMKTQMESK